ncbi:unnamed protein product [Caenorhabditis bovis]|uniref:Uncharacterized protein n=1 Tax=Caenorhabditis bovis TaxID=2654633 RepID=A0A8S1EGP1_9PELO|nr:unnamed protein product [Caenorhabditis bovis]
MVIRGRFDVVDVHRRRVLFWRPRRGSRQCFIVHATRNNTDVSLEVGMKLRYADCEVVKLDPFIERNDERIRFFSHQLSIGYSDSDRLDLATLTSVVLKASHIEALYLDESVPYQDLLFNFDGAEISELLDVCQLSVVVRRPESQNDLTFFWSFVTKFLINPSITLVDSQRISMDRVRITVYNRENRNCVFRHHFKDIPSESFYA